MRIVHRGFVALLILILAGALPAGAVTLQQPDATQSDDLAQLDSILDLLIDGHFAEARDQAARLLEREDLPETVSAWALKLREKAEERLGDSSGGPMAPAESPAGVASADQGQPASDAQYFSVRQALIGGGFAAGVSGSLRISAEGLAFTQKGRTKVEWSVRWRDLSEARRDGGLWDAPEPLVIADRRGRKHYLVRIDGKGRYLSGGPILSAIEQGRKQRKSAAEKAEEQH